MVIGVSSRETEPPSSAAAETAPPSRRATQVEALLERFLNLPEIQVTAPPPPDPWVDRSASTMPAPGKLPTLEAFDEQLAMVEPMLEQRDWGGVSAALAPRKTLPPPLALVYAIALRECGQGDPEELATRAVAALLCVPETSETARLIVKRLLT